ncbi:CASP-like protein 1F1 [Cucurbita pepo subsp. pepo]|uniref:CASP-like protein 1F1 n=1 Tax=Cucurbita pepo subsp. pepo TaxID=3664 RepID=UPI000C9D5075|nr:CASP-like protein 1F1 [Cucurbita pepo subsp. pepo]
MADNNNVELEAKSQGPHANLYLSSQIILRALVISSTLAATWTLTTAKQSVVIFGFTLDARYSYSSAFKFFALANAIACGFCLLSLCFVFISSRQLALGNRQRNFSFFFFFFVHDLLMMGLVVSGCAAATAIGFVGRYGNTHTGWSPICDQFAKFCNRITISIAISYFAVLCLLILTIISAYPTKLHR